MDPIALFNQWYAEEKEQTPVRIPAACCLSTLGLDGYPNARFLALKEIVEGDFVITGPLGGRKGQEVAAHPKVALTFWWTATERQVRLQGDAVRISDQEADRYFFKRLRPAKVVSQTFTQGQPLQDTCLLEEQFKQMTTRLEGESIERPANWGGLRIRPLRIEFLDFKVTRLHERLLFSRTGDNWSKGYLQP
ncbi:MAG: pyridoxal 5'-phosphate synthase [Bacteroidota bacterium]